MFNSGLSVFIKVLLLLLLLLLLTGLFSGNHSRLVRAFGDRWYMISTGSMPFLTYCQSAES